MNLPIQVRKFSRHNIMHYGSRNI